MMNPIFKLNHYPSPLMVASLGLVLLSTSFDLRIAAQEAPNPTRQENTNQQQPSNTPSESDQQSPKTETEKLTQEQRDDRVYISDIYPEYCRSYFLRRDYVSLNEYYAGMTRCKYGNDRWSY